MIYLDYSATTPPRREAIAAAESVLTETWGNPASIHGIGERSALVLETARWQVAAAINAEPTEIVFTGSGTEADNLAILGVAEGFDTPRQVIVSSVEHSAVAVTVDRLRKRGWEIVYLPVDSGGRVKVADLVAAIDTNTAIVSIIYAQSEVGTVQPIAELAAICRQWGIVFHTDAVQAIGRIAIDVKELDIDLLSLSSHKIYGTQGVGALYVRKGCQLTPLITGGSQENGWRSGTPNLSGIAAFGVAISLAVEELTAENTRLQALRDRLFSQLADIPALAISGDRIHRLPHHASFRVIPGQDRPHGRQIVRTLSKMGIAISAGSACNSGKTTPSKVLLAMGCDAEAALGGIRITLGRYTTEEDIDRTATALKFILSSDVEKI
jgi:cysteine desulfurase